MSSRDVSVSTISLYRENVPDSQRATDTQERVKLPFSPSDFL